MSHCDSHARDSRTRQVAAILEALREIVIEKFHEGDWEWDDEGDEDVTCRFVCEVDEDDNIISNEEEI